MPKPPTKQAHIIYSGTVHGVGFRWTAESVANSLGLTGWVQNRPDGTVEVLCEGEEGAIEAFTDKIKDAMARYIRSSKVDWGKAAGKFDSFTIKFFS